MLIHYRSLTLAAALLLGALGCGDDDENDCRGVDDDGDGFILKCAGPRPDNDGGGTGARGGSGGSGARGGSGGSGGKDAGDDLDSGADDDAGN